MTLAQQAPQQIDRTIRLDEEEISDVSLSTFFVFHAENVPALPVRNRRPGGGCGCSSGCGSS
jgi:hypothetical protein